MNLLERNKFIREFFADRCRPLMGPRYDDDTKEQMERFFDDLCMGELDRKGHDYSHGGQVDANRNFKEVAEKLGISVCVIWAVYFWKHADSIIGWLDGNDLKAEGIQSRVTDAVNYLLIFASLLHDQNCRKLERSTVNQHIAEAVIHLLRLGVLDRRHEDLGNVVKEDVDQVLKDVGVCIQS